jgi:hypothetical protein
MTSQIFSTTAAGDFILAQSHPWVVVLLREAALVGTPRARLFREAASSRSLRCNHRTRDWHLVACAFRGRDFASPSCKSVRRKRCRGTRTATFSPAAAVTAILRINTKGGQLAGACNEAGTIMAVSYAADYMFLKK